jgi:hypothetical protein
MPDVGTHQIASRLEKVQNKNSGAKNNERQKYRTTHNAESTGQPASICRTVMPVDQPPVYATNEELVRTLCESSGRPLPAASGAAREA